jgi:DNA uptake protein ComE-like DNA-binding protein
MKAHSYIRYNLANTIFQNRKRHGPFTSLEEIKDIMLVNDLAFQKMAPYLPVE